MGWELKIWKKLHVLHVQKRDLPTECPCRSMIFLDLSLSLSRAPPRIPRRTFQWSRSGLSRHAFPPYLLLVPSMLKPKAPGNYRFPDRFPVVTAKWRCHGQKPRKKTKSTPGGNSEHRRGMHRWLLRPAMLPWKKLTRTVYSQCAFASATDRSARRLAGCGYHTGFFYTVIIFGFKIQKVPAVRRAVNHPAVDPLRNSRRSSS